MRFLKNKIAKALQYHENQPRTGPELLDSDKVPEVDPVQLEPTPQPKKKEKTTPAPRRSKKGKRRASDKVRANKNLLKNYGKAICSFSVSDIALPYLTPIAHKEKVEIHDFAEFVTNIKETLDSIQTFRAALLIDDDDSDQVKAYKRMFAYIGEIFIKYFSVNWIFSGRITHRDAHLKFRFKMLRRIKDPESFTYIQKPRKEDKF